MMSVGSRAGFKAADANPARRDVLCGAVGISVTLLTSEGAAQSGARRKAAPPRTPPSVIIGRGAADLPPAVADMRSEILSAVETGDIAELKRPMDLNELKPEVGAGAGSDVIEHLRALSGDAKGSVLLDELGRLLEAKWASIPGGRDIENNRMVVWPHFAEVAFDTLSGEDRAALEALCGAERAKAMIAAGRYEGWRLTIGADGVWHSLLKVAP